MVQLGAITAAPSETNNVNSWKFSSGEKFHQFCHLLSLACIANFFVCNVICGRYSDLYCIAIEQSDDQAEILPMPSKLLMLTKVS